MKKLLITLTAVAMLVMSIVAVSAAEVDSETFLETRLERLDEALESGLITQEQYDRMVEHMTERSESGVFGRGPNGYLNQEYCVLGEDGNLQLFRNENSGLKNGQGNGIRQERADGSGFGGGRGQGLRLCR